MYREKLSHSVLHITFQICTHRVAIPRMVEPSVKRIERVRRRWWIVLIADLTQVLTTARCDQPVECVIGVVVARLDSLIAEEDRLLSVVTNVSDVADWIKGVGKVL